MKKLNNQLVLMKDDYNLLVTYLNNRSGKTTFDRQNAEDLFAELKKAKLVSKDEFPADVVRLNSTVRIKPEDKDYVMELTIVTPDKADIKERKISIMSPIGTALIGFRQGRNVKWQVPSGKKTFTILEVNNGK
ncbi:MAG TPA: GreA/GreB family elongation factor [Chitinophagaceae bacterium]|jgi:regulator of nucleoside diphosphate kinase